jgi:hypothetical protein
MPNPNEFPASAVVASFIATERTLVDVLEIVPYCNEHENVWSPRLATVIMEACSQLDSLWSHEARQSSFLGPDLNLKIKHHFKHFACKVGYRWAVFWADPPVQLRPYKTWDGVTEYAPLEWWQAYNDLKHNRLEYLKRATLSAAVNAVAGLFLAVVASEYCREAIESANWLSAGQAVAHNPKATLSEDWPSANQNFVAAESRLFTYPVGWCRETTNPNTEWDGDASFRFRHWWRTYRR